MENLINQKVVIKGHVYGTKHDKIGILLFYGETLFRNGMWAGVELEKKEGRNNGSVDGKRYFTCKEGHGLFVHPSRIRSLEENRNVFEITPAQEDRKEPAYSFNALEEKMKELETKYMQTIEKTELELRISKKEAEKALKLKDETVKYLKNKQKIKEEQKNKILEENVLLKEEIKNIKNSLKETAQREEDLNGQLQRLIKDYNELDAAHERQGAYFQSELRKKNRLPKKKEKKQTKTLYVSVRQKEMIKSLIKQIEDIKKKETHLKDKSECDSKIVSKIECILESSVLDYKESIMETVKEEFKELNKEIKETTFNSNKTPSIKKSIEKTILSTPMAQISLF